MHEEWLLDGRQIPDEVMGYIRKMAVHAVRERGESPELVARIVNFNRSCIYRWLKQYDAGGYAALDSRMPPGASPLITSEMDEWLKQIVLNSTPATFGRDTVLWTCGILADLLEEEFDVTVSNVTIYLHLKKLGLSCQTPAYQDVKREPQAVEQFLNDKFPRIQRLAHKIGADIGFEDEAGVGVMTRRGRTWGLVGKTPVVPVSMERGGYNLLSMVTAQGDMRYAITDEHIQSERYIEFLQQLIQSRQRPLIVLVDRAPFHTSQKVRDFVRAHRARLRIYFLPKRAPELNPDEQVWNEVKHRRIGKQPVKSKKDLKKRLYSTLGSLQKRTERILSFSSCRIPSMQRSMYPS